MINLSDTSQLRTQKSVISRYGLAMTSFDNFVTDFTTFAANIISNWITLRNMRRKRNTNKTTNNKQKVTLFAMNANLKYNINAYSAHQRYSIAILQSLKGFIHCLILYVEVVI